MKKRFLIAAISCTFFFTACSSGGSNNSGNTSNTQVEERTEHLAGGTATTPFTNALAFSKSSRNMASTRVTVFNEGNHFFENPWVEAKASTEARDGLGPYFNSNACQNCHVRDGRGHAGATEKLDGIETSDDFNTLLIRVVKSDISETDRNEILASSKANVPDSVVGGQLQHKAMSGVQKESTLGVSYTAKTVQFTDGHTVELRIPKWHIQSHLGTMDSDSVFSARVAPPMIGLGLLELIDEADIYAQQDITDADMDGVSGKANKVYSQETNSITLGRFGWKAGVPSLLEQTAGAFHGDMGLTSRFHTEQDCHSNQVDCLNAQNGNDENNSTVEDVEVIDSMLNTVTFYTKHLAVPKRRKAYSEQVQQGKKLFNNARCTACHTPSYTTATSLEQPELSEQKIYPYTDLLVHDMGDDLADFDINNNPALKDGNGNDIQQEFLATTKEWRTPPLWGLGLTKTVDPDATFLHDGRARTIMEAVLWHGGEAETAKQKVLTFNSTERAALLAFLNDL